MEAANAAKNCCCCCCIAAAVAPAVALVDVPPCGVPVTAPAIWTSLVFGCFLITTGVAAVEPCPAPAGSSNDGRSRLPSSSTDAPTAVPEVVLRLDVQLEQGVDDPPRCETAPFVKALAACAAAIGPSPPGDVGLEAGRPRPWPFPLPPLPGFLFRFGLSVNELATGRKQGTTNTSHHCSCYSIDKKLPAQQLSWFISPPSALTTHSYIPAAAS